MCFTSSERVFIIGRQTELQLHSSFTDWSLCNDSLHFETQTLECLPNLFFPHQISRLVLLPALFHWDVRLLAPVSLYCIWTKLIPERCGCCEVLLNVLVLIDLCLKWWRSWTTVPVTRHLMPFETQINPEWPAAQVILLKISSVNIRLPILLTIFQLLNEHVVS